MSELLMKGLVTTRRELEAGIADAEAELARNEEYCRKLEELIAVGKATLHSASQMNFQQFRPAAAEGPVSVGEAAGQAEVTDLQRRLAKDTSK